MTRAHDPQLLAQAAADAEATRDQPATASAARRSKPTADPATVYSARVPVALFKRLRMFADGRGTTPSALLREWILDRLETETGAVSTSSDQLHAAAAYLSDVARKLDTMAATGSPGR